MPLPWLTKDVTLFPPPESANEEGILAIGGDLSPERLLVAYSEGIFPWFNPNDPILWWSPDPRFVLFPNELKVAKSMRPYFNRQKFEVSFDRDFPQVMRECQQPRLSQWGGTWITESMLEAYTRLHKLGFAHSVEVWQDGELVGGLYGVSLGKVFFGESMFAKASNASKFGFISLVKKLEERGFWLIDCQQQTEHLASLGARAISRAAFLEILKRNKQEETLRGDWGKLL